AQHAVGTVTLQPKVGMNVASLTDMKGSDPRIGLAAGAEVEYQVADIASVSAGVLYSMQGGKCEGEMSFLGFSQSGKLTYKLDYINIPIMANVYVLKGLAVKFGVQPAFNVHSAVEASTRGTAGSGSQAVNVKANTFDFSLPVGLSYEYNNVVLDARYNWGLTRAMENKNSQNSVFQITLGYKFAL
ncbi:MAG: porin family protein, partial [Prevotella sp.]